MTWRSDNDAAATERQRGNDDAVIAAVLVTACDQDQNPECRSRPFPPRVSENPATQNDCQPGVIDRKFKRRGRAHEKERLRPGGHPFAENDHEIHPKPGAMIEQLCHPWQPGATNQTAKTAGECETAQRHDQQIRE